VASGADDGVIIAAGALLWRRAGQGGVSVALVHRPKYDDWSLPKGKLDAGEHVAVGAVREVTEETGYTVRLGRPLPAQRYLVDGRQKVVHYWAAQADGDGSFAPTREVDQVAWLEPKVARDRMTHPRDADILDAFLDGPAVTEPLLVLRHSKAVKRSEWDGDDGARPLSKVGTAQAAVLVEVLAPFAPDRVLSSDTRRCLDTVAPYAESRGLTIECEPLFSESGFRAQPAAGRARAEELLRSGTPTILCTHRPVLPELIGHLCSVSGVPAPERSVEPALEPGGFYVLHTADGRVVAVERHAP
jgi:8-oxo-dGTP diphosphatase